MKSTCWLTYQRPIRHCPESLPSSAMPRLSCPHICLPLPTFSSVVCSLAVVNVTDFPDGWMVFSSSFILWTTHTFMKLFLFLIFTMQCAHFFHWAWRPNDNCLQGIPLYMSPRHENSTSPMFRNPPNSQGCPSWANGIMESLTIHLSEMQIQPLSSIPVFCLVAHLIHHEF